LEPNTTSTYTRNESEGIKRSQSESKGNLGYKLLGMSHR